MSLSRDVGIGNPPEDIVFNKFQANVVKMQDYDNQSLGEDVIQDGGGKFQYDPQSVLQRWLVVLLFWFYFTSNFSQPENSSHHEGWQSRLVSYHLVDASASLATGQQFGSGVLCSESLMFDYHQNVQAMVWQLFQQNFPSSQDGDPQDDKGESRGVFSKIPEKIVFSKIPQKIVF
jgi:hypothetical protein